jgi:hypothetical protein
MEEVHPIATLIGDVVGSRDAPARHRLHDRLAAALDAVNAVGAPVTPLRITVGDEFQGCFASLGEALRAARELRLLLLPDIDIRCGLGWGPVQVLGDEPRVEDGPGWWAARDAIEEVARVQGKPAMRRIRTAYRIASGATGPDPNAVNAALIGRDTLIGALDARSLSVLRGLLAGMSQREIATAEAVTASAVSQRVRRDGLGALVAAEELLVSIR